MKPIKKDSLKIKIAELAAVAMVMSMGFLPSANAQSSDHVGGGGDASEMRVNDIRSDIASWISAGGADALSFENSQTNLNSYKSEMNKVLLPHAVIVTFTNEEVRVEKEPKTCRGYIEEEKYHISCNIDRFKVLNAPEQYRLVHHEYAGLAGVESNVGASSDYVLSDQITESLRKTTVYKLAVLNQKAGEGQNSPAVQAWNKKMLLTLNNVCADTWCEGDFIIHFNDFNCDFNQALTFGKNGKCEVGFTMHPYSEFHDQDDNRIETPKRSHINDTEGSCDFLNYPNQQSVDKPDKKMPYDKNLSNRFYQELTNCIDGWTAHAK